MKVAIALNSAHKSWREKHDTNTKKIEKYSGKSLKTAPDEKHLGETKRSNDTTDTKEELNDDQKKMIANFRYLTWSISCQKYICKIIILRFRQLVESKRGSIKVSNILHESTMLSSKYRSRH